MSKFKIGDRVAVYGPFSMDGDTQVNGRRTGRVSEVWNTGLLRIGFDKAFDKLAVHPKQCRKLKRARRYTIAEFFNAISRAVPNRRVLTFIERLAIIKELK